MHVDNRRKICSKGVRARGYSRMLSCIGEGYNLDSTSDDSRMASNRSRIVVVTTALQ